MTTNSKVAVKKEIKEEFVPLVVTVDKEDNCMDLSISNRKNVSDSSRSIKKESGVPDNNKNSLNQSGVDLSPNVSPMNSNGSEHLPLPSLSNSAVVPEITPLINLDISHRIHSELPPETTTTDMPLPLTSVSVSTIATTTSSSEVAPSTYRHLSVQTMPQSHVYRSGASSSAVVIKSTPSVVPVPAAATQTVSSVATVYAPVQEQALDLSGLELLSSSVCQHANRLSSEEPVPLSLSQAQFHSPKDLSSNTITDSHSIVPGDLSSASPVAPLARSPLTSVTTSEATRTTDSNNLTCSTSHSAAPTPGRLSLSSPQPSENFILLCALASEELERGGEKEKVEARTSIDRNVATVNEPSDLSVTQSSFNGSISSVTAAESLNNIDQSSSLSLSVSSQVSENCTTTTSYSDTSSPLDLSLSVAKKHAGEQVEIVCKSSKIYEKEASLSMVSLKNSSPTSGRSSDGNQSSDSFLTTKKLLCTYDSSSSDSQNFEGFEDSSSKRGEENVRKQLTKLAKTYMKKVAQVHRQYSNSEIGRRPAKRKRCPSESSSRRSESRCLKHHGDEKRQRLSSLQETPRDRHYSDDNDEPKVVPTLSISKLKRKKLRSPRVASRMPGYQSSSGHEIDSSDDDADNLPRRKWSRSFLSNDKSSRSHKSVVSLPAVADVNDSEEDRAAGEFSDSSETNSKAPNTETSAFESSDHETSCAPKSSSKKRKPGRPKKHSPTKKDATETIVTKKHKNLNLLMRHPNLISSKSKVKPKLKAEVSI